MNKWMLSLPKIANKADFQEGFMEGFGLAILGPRVLMEEFRRVNPGLAGLIDGFVDVLVDAVQNKLTPEEIDRMKQAAIIGQLATLRWVARAMEV